MNQSKKSLVVLSFLILSTTIDWGTEALAQQPPGEAPSKNVQKSTFLKLVSDVPLSEAASAQTARNKNTSDVGENDNDKQSTQFTHSGDHTTAALSSGYSDELTLGDLRDSGIALNQIRQEAINIFLEATRTICDKTTQSELVIPKAITGKDLMAPASKTNYYLPPRPQWLFYYVGTMEPIISMLSQDVYSAKTGLSKILVPASTLAKLKPHWNEWTTGIADINKELTAISNLVDSKEPNNAALAKHAAAMYNLTEKLEHTRQKAFLIIRDASKHGNSSEKENLSGDK